MKSTEKKTSESENGTTNVENMNNKSFNYELLEREEVKGTPFTVIKGDIENNTQFEGWGIFFGKYLMETPYKTKNEAIKEAKKVTWDRVIKVISILNK